MAQARSSFFCLNFIFKISMVQPDRLPSIWSSKPWWCQPWSIVLTGVTLISGSWLLFKLVWVTVLVALPVLVWMGFFLLLYPRLMMSEILSAAAEQPGQESTKSSSP